MTFEWSFLYITEAVKDKCLPVDDQEEWINTELELEDFISSFEEDDDSVDDEIETFDNCRELLDS